MDEPKDVTQQEAEYAGFVDRGTEIVLQEAIQKVVESFSQTDAMEDILGYLEEMRENIHSMEERLKESQQREKQIGEKVGAAETSVRNLLQRIQSMEVQLAGTSDRVDSLCKNLTRLISFFERAPLARMFSRMESEEEDEQFQFSRRSDGVRREPAQEPKASEAVAPARPAVENPAPPPPVAPPEPPVAKVAGSDFPLADDSEEDLESSQEREEKHE